MDQGFKASDWVYSLWLAALSFFAGILHYQKYKEDRDTRDRIKSNAEDHRDLWNQKADKNDVILLREDLKTMREESKEDRKEILDMLKSLQGGNGRSHR